MARGRRLKGRYSLIANQFFLPVLLMADPIFQLQTSSNDSQYIIANLCYPQRPFFICANNWAVANISELSSKDENITPQKPINHDKCSFATKQRIFGVFAIEEPGSPVPALYAPLPPISCFEQFDLLLLNVWLIKCYWMEGSGVRVQRSNFLVLSI